MDTDKALKARCSKDQAPFEFGVEQPNLDTIVLYKSYKVYYDTPPPGSGDSGELTGNLHLQEGVACAWCSTAGLAKCGKCGRLTCWGGDAIVTCSWCGDTHRINGTIKSVDASGLQ